MLLGISCRRWFWSIWKVLGVDGDFSQGVLNARIVLLEQFLLLLAILLFPVFPLGRFYRVVELLPQK